MAIDLVAPDLKESQGFHTALFGWSYQLGDAEKYGAYTTPYKDEQLVTGPMRLLVPQRGLGSIDASHSTRKLTRTKRRKSPKFW